MEESSMWYIFIAIVAILLIVEFASIRKSHKVPMKSAIIQTIVWISIALAFGVLVYMATTPEKAMEYYTAYTIEKAMSIDNLFVFLILFTYFGIREEDQHKALFYGIAGAIVFRAIFIFAGVELLERFNWLLYVFGIILLYVAFKTLRDKDDGSKENKLAHYMKNRFDYVDNETSRGKLFVKINGRRVFTTLFLCIIVIELTDIVFALDSIPAVLSIYANSMPDTLVLYTSNIFAVLGLRSLFFVIEGGLNSLCYLKYGLGIVLAFVAAKLLLHDFIEIPIELSLAFILVVLGLTVVVSLMKTRADRARISA